MSPVGVLLGREVDTTGPVALAFVAAGAAGAGLPFYAIICLEASRRRVELTEQHSVGSEVTATADRTPADGEWSVGSLLRAPGGGVHRT